MPSWPNAPLPGYSTPSTMQDIENIDVQVNTVDVNGVAPVGGQLPTVDSTTGANTGTIAANTAPCTAPVAGQKTNITGPVALGGSTACRNVMLRADPGNGQNVLVGDSNHQYFYITTTDVNWLTMPVSNLNLIYVASANGSTAVKVNYIVLP